MATRKAQSTNAPLQIAQPCVTVTQVKNYSALSSVELDSVIKTNVDRCEKFIAGFNKSASELFPALLEMESRFEKKQGARNDLFELKVEGWHNYLESRGVNPATFRKWKQRSASMKQLQAIVEPPKPPRSRISANSVNSDGGRLDERQSDLLAKAGLRLAETLLNPLFTESERITKALQQAEELLEAKAVGNYEVALRPSIDTTDDPVGDLPHYGLTQIMTDSVSLALTRMTVSPTSSQSANEAKNAVDERALRDAISTVLAFLPTRYSEQEVMSYLEMLGDQVANELLERLSVANNLPEK